MVIYTPAAFLILGLKIAKKKDKQRTDKAKVRFFRTAYGSSPEVCSHTWEYLVHHKVAPKKAEPEHLLWAMIFLKSYATEAFLSALVGVTEKTFRKWIWQMINSISRIYKKIVSILQFSILKVPYSYHFSPRFYGATDYFGILKISGAKLPLTELIYFKINQPVPFSKRWYSHKFKSAGLRYEVSLSITGGYIVWTNGPFPYGAWPDISIFRCGLMQKLVNGEMSEADKGYRGQRDKIRLPSDYATKEEKERKTMARSRQEHVNARFKNYRILKLPFRHDLKLHKNVFRSICILTQLAIESGKILWTLEHE